MTNAEHQAGAGPQPPAGLEAAAEFTRSAAGSEWVASRYADVQAVLADDRFEVAPVADTGAVPGTIAWLRASASRFANGAEHQQRRALAVSELGPLDPRVLRADARQRAQAVLAAAGSAGDRIDAMSLLARPVPMAALAASLQAGDPAAAATAVMAAAAAYFGGADEPTTLAADAGTAALLDLLGPAATNVLVARITLLVQACDGTAGLIGETLRALQEAPGSGAGWPTDGVLTEVLRCSPPVRLSRRVAREPVRFGGCPVQAGDVVVGDLDAANSDPAVFDQPGQFDPARPGPPSLTFGSGLRPCPAPRQALALAAGVVDAVRQKCAFLPGQQIEYEPPAALRIPRRLDVTLH
jgi:cytochrome P450